MYRVAPRAWISRQKRFGPAGSPHAGPNGSQRLNRCGGTCDVWLLPQEQPDVVPQLTHLWQLPFGIMIEPHSGQVGASVRAMKL